MLSVLFYLPLRMDHHSLLLFPKVLLSHFEPFEEVGAPSSYECPRLLFHGGLAPNELSLFWYFFAFAPHLWCEITLKLQVPPCRKSCTAKSHKLFADIVAQPAGV